MTKHTPGPWRVNDADVFQDNPLDSVVMIAHCTGASVAHNEHLANARLIAAAPETAAERDRLRVSKHYLLKALRKVEEIFRNGETPTAFQYCQVVEAIKEAEGEKGE